MAEYGKAIAFDYSYRYFYGDGYGKDFHILNLQQATTPRIGRIGCCSPTCSPFANSNSSLPIRTRRSGPTIWPGRCGVFVGGSVNAVYTERRQPRSDILTVVRFLHRLIANSSWAMGEIDQLMAGNSGLRDADGKDIFADKFEYLRGRDSATVYRDILARVLHASAGSGLHLCNIRGRDGEIGLKVGGAEDYFGLIYIGDTAKFKNLVAADNAGIALEEDAFSGSLFDGINAPGNDHRGC